MRESKLKNVIAISIATSKFLIIVWLLLLFLAESYSFDDFISIMSIILPAFSVHASVIIRYTVMQRYKNQAEDREVKASFLYTTLAMLFFYTLAIIATLAYRHDVGPEAMENVKTSLGLIETVFGGYLGYAIANLFRIQAEIDLG
ncbi:hypothetical protein [Thermoflexibacter ruber]|uniref:Uncharacterized protein n=1 Tax=Thermoflexibacter ruber TaxID=1003 RepID=A0A1I2C199_9BACT|nr:hypothetical protein [Thermoflexibacter ruber]SFE62117.1 hypothetical protein SAMN04488541_100432 [Thermoflexibacter ruber]